VLLSFLIRTTNCVSFLLVGCFVGCDATKVDPSTNKATTTGVQSASQQSNSSPGQATPALDEAQAKIVRDAKGEVTSVDLRGCQLSEAVLKEIASLSSLQQLDLRECNLNNEQFATAVKPLTKLKALRLNGKGGATSVDDNGISALAGCTDLRVLSVDEIWISLNGLKHLEGCKQLSELYAKESTLDDESMAVLAQFKQLKKLRLAKTSVSPVGMRALEGLKLEELDVSECTGINDQALQIIGKFTTLKRLNLWRDAVSDTGLGQLAGLTGLTWYNLDNTQLTDAGLDHLAGMAELTFLHLGSTGVSDAGMPKLLGLKKLKDLKVTRTSVTEAGAKLIEEKIPGVQVQVVYREDTE
jgi:hypothetical protein